MLQNRDPEEEALEARQLAVTAEALQRSREEIRKLSRILAEEQAKAAAGKGGGAVEVSRAQDPSLLLEIQRQRSELVKLTELLGEAQREISDVRAELSNTHRVIPFIVWAFVERCRMPLLDRFFKPMRRRWLEESGLFDREWYLYANRDVAEAGVDPLLHFLRHGAREGRPPVNYGKPPQKLGFRKDGGT